MTNKTKRTIPILPVRDRVIGEDGIITRPWVLALQQLGIVNSASTGDSSGGSGSAGTEPTQPTSTDWTVHVAEYGHDDQTGKNVARIEAIVTLNSADIRYYSAYACAAADPPTDLSQYADVCNTMQAESGPTTLTWWVDRPATAAEYQIIVVASSSTYTAFPKADSPVKNVLVTAIHVPAQVTGFTAQVFTESRGGVPCGALAFTYTPPADIEYFTAKVYKIATDATYTPLAGDEWAEVGNAVAGFDQRDLQQWWPLPSDDEYALFKAQSISRAGLENTVDPPTATLHIPASSGVGTSGPPPQPSATDWTISLSQYGHDDQTGKNLAEIRVVVTLNDPAIRYFSVYWAEGSTPPVSLSAYADVCDTLKATTGPTTLLFWVDRPAVGTTYQACVVASSTTYTAVPDLSTPTKPLTLLPIQPPAQVTNLVASVTVEDRGGVACGAFTFSYDPPADPEYFTAKVYLIFTDSSYTPLPGEEWGEIGSAVSGFDQRQSQTWWPLGTEAWLLAKVQSVSRAGLENTVSPPTAQLHISASAGVGAPLPPPQPVAADWSISVAGYGHDDQTGKNLAQVQAVVTLNDPAIRYFSVYWTQAATPPANLSLYTDVCDTIQAASGPTTLVFWVDRPAAASTYQAIIVASSSTYTGVPSSSSPVKSLALAPIQAPAQVTGLSALVAIENRGGITCGAFAFDYTPPADPEYFTGKVYLIATDSSYTPLAGATWAEVGNGVAGFDQRELQQWWPLAGESWAKVKVQSVSRAGLENTAFPPTANLHISASPGISTGAAAPTQPTSFAATVVEYGYDPIAARPAAHLRVTVPEYAISGAIFNLWYASGVSAPAALYAWGDSLNMAAAASGPTTIDWWVPRSFTANTTWWLRLRVSTATYLEGPGDTGPADVSIVVTKVGVPAQVTGASVTVLTSNRGGADYGRFAFAFTAPLDPEFFTCNIYRLFCDAAFNPLAGETWHLVASTPESFTQALEDAWPLAGVSYCRFKFQSVSRAIDAATGLNVENTASAPTVNVTIGGSSGLDPTQFNWLKMNSTEFTVGLDGKFTMAGVDFSKGFNFDGGQFAKIGGTTLTVTSLAADVLKSGTVLVGGGSGKPGRLVVYNASAVPDGWIGDDTAASGYDGAWFKRILLGGSSPATAKFVCDSSGNASFSGSLAAGVSISSPVINGGSVSAATFTLSYNGLTTTISNSSVTVGGATVAAGLSIANNLTGRQSVVSDGLIHLRNNAGGPYFFTYADSFASYVYLGASDGSTLNQFGFKAPTSGNAEMRVAGVLCIQNSAWVSTVNSPSAPVTAFRYYIGGGAEVINYLGQFVGSGVSCQTSGIGGANFNVFQGGWYYGVAGPSTFLSADGRSVTVRGGIITAIA